MDTKKIGHCCHLTDYVSKLILLYAYKRTKKVCNRPKKGLHHLLIRCKIVKMYFLSTFCLSILLAYMVFRLSEK